MEAWQEAQQPAPGKASRLETGLLLLVFFALPFQFAAQLTARDTDGMSLTVGKLLILATMAVFGMRFLAQRDATPIRSLVGNTASVLMLAFLWISTVGLIPAHSLIFGLAYLSQRVNLAILYFLVINLITSLRQLRAALVSLFLGSMVAAFGGLYELLTLQAVVPNVYSKQNLLVTTQGSTRIQSFAGDPDMHGSFLVSTSGLLVYLLLYVKRPWLELVMLGCILLYFVNIMGTGSRAAWIGIAVSAAAFFIFQPLRHKFLVLAGVLLVAGATVFLLDVTGSAAISERVTSESVGGSGDKSIEYRIGWMIMSTHMFADHPILGVGTGNYTQEYYRYLRHAGTWSSALERKPNHNAFMQVLAENGLPGIVIFCSLMGCLLWYGVSLCLATRGEARNMAVGLLACYLGWLYCICVYPALTDEYGWLAASFIVVLRQLVKDDPALRTGTIAAKATVVKP